MNTKKTPISEVIFSSSNNLLMLLICFITIYPFYYVLIVSLNVGTDTTKGGLWLFPRVLTLDNFSTIFTDGSIFYAYIVTISRTVIGTVTSVIFTAAFAYGITRRDLVGRNFYIVMGTITMFFSGGLIPYYLLIHQLHLLDNFLVYILPSLFTFWNVIIFQGFFREIPNALGESAKIDGANDIYIFFKIIMPVATPAIACIALFNGVWHWNSWMDSYLFINNQNLQTLQCLLVKFITQNSFDALNMNFTQVLGGADSQTYSMQSIRAATIMVAIIPVIFIYPFLQKYFTKGLILGSIKG